MYKYTKMNFFAIYFLATLQLIQGTHWSYDGSLDVAHWSNEFPECGKHHQSPINIERDKAEFDATLQMPNFFGYFFPNLYQLTFLNNGHTAVAKVISDDHDVFVSGGGLSGDWYITKQFHFHWGEDSSKGSEHLIDGRSFPLECHIVNYNAKYKSLTNAASKTDGLAVLSILFEVSAYDNDDLKPVIDALSKIKYNGNSVQIKNFALSRLFPNDSYCFYRYAGSLTTPACYESVTWTVFSETVPISERQLQQFRALYEDSLGGKKIGHNNRPPKDLYGRHVFKSCLSFDPFKG